MSSSTSKPVKATLLYDVISPWTYLALALLKRHEKEWNLDIHLEPVSIGYLFQAAGNKAPLTVPNKGKMMAQEFRLYSDYYQIPTSPDAWTYSLDAQKKPPNSLPLMRILHVLAQQHPEQHERAATLLFDAVFARGDTALLHGVAGKDREGEVARLHELLGALLSKEQLGKLWDASVTQEVKDAVKAQAQKCVKEQGAYGVPYTTFERADGKKLSFMGQDRFEIITDWLGHTYKPLKMEAQQQSKL